MDRWCFLGGVGASATTFALSSCSSGSDDLRCSRRLWKLAENRWPLEQALPRLVRAADGDPATDPNA